MKTKCCVFFLNDIMFHQEVSVEIIKMNKYSKIYTTLDYIVSQILLNLRHVLKGFVKQYNQELCISSITRCFTERLQMKPLK